MKISWEGVEGKQIGVSNVIRACRESKAVINNLTRVCMLFKYVTASLLGFIERFERWQGILMKREAHDVASQGIEE